MNKVRITIERIGDMAQMQIVREGKEPIVVNITDYDERVESVGKVSLAVMTGTEVPFE